MKLVDSRTFLAASAAASLTAVRPHAWAAPAQGQAVAFDGQDDALFIDEHPLAGAKTFTFEACFVPMAARFVRLASRIEH
jgi:hypothetical protein